MLDEPSLPGTGYKALDREGFDDGGVADLTLVIDLEDSVLRRKRGETDYFTALKADLLPRITRGPLAHLTRRDQKIKLAKLLFSEEEHEEDKSPSEVWMDTVDGQEDAATKKHRADRLASARMALSLSSLLREPACASLSLSEISKRRLAFFGKEGADAALRCADKAIDIACDGFWDSDEIAIEVRLLVLLPLLHLLCRILNTEAVCRLMKTPLLIPNTKRTPPPLGWPTRNP